MEVDYLGFTVSISGKYGGKFPRNYAQLFHDLRSLGCSYNHLERSLANRTIAGFKAKPQSFYPHLALYIDDIVDPYDGGSTGIYSQPSAGSIVTEVHLNATQYDYGLSIPSTGEASAAQGGFVYRWQRMGGSGAWEYVDAATASLDLAVPAQYATRFRRHATNPAGVAISNECTVYNHAFMSGQYPGSSFGAPMAAGACDSDFIFRALADTRNNHEDICYDEAHEMWIEFTLQHEMDVEITVHSPHVSQINIAIADYDCEASEFHRGHSRLVYDGVLSDYDTATSIFSGIEEQIFPQVTLLPLPAGRYRIMLEGPKSSNAGQRNGYIYAVVTGRRV